MKQRIVGTDKSRDYQLEREIISRILGYSHEELTLDSFSNKTLDLLLEYGLLKNKITALWECSSQEELSIIASHGLNLELQNQLHEVISYLRPDGQLLSAEAVANDHSSTRLNTRIDIYLEKTPNSLFGISFWAESKELGLKLITPFFKDLLSLINLALLKITGIRDIAAQKSSEDTIRKLTRALEQSPVLVMITDKTGIIEYVNAKVLQQTGYSSEEIIGQNSRILQSGKTPTEIYNFMWEQLTHGEEWRGELLNKNKKGEYFWVSAIISPLRNDDNENAHYLAVMEDISQKKSYEKMLKYQSTYDNLTNLPNRFYGYNKLEHVIAKAHKNKKKLAILFLDLDEFKQINDSLGHSVGDLLLKALSERYVSVIRKRDIIARLGDDEFMIILENLHSINDAERIAKKCQDICLRPFQLESHEVFVSSSIGIAIYPEHGADGKTLMRNADAAMYQSKMRGKNNSTVFINAMAEVATNRIRIKSELRQVLDRDELYIRYQPIINVDDNKIFAAEALLRWNSATLGHVMPEQIIPIAEEAGLIIPLGYWILKKVCSHVKEWQVITRKKIKIAVNISTIQLKQKDFVDQVALILQEEDVTAESLIFEITESAFIDDSTFILEQLNRLNQMNIHCSLDDFGMGYSSLNYIRSFPFKSLKIDRAFIQGIDVSNDDLSLVNSIITMSRNLKLAVIAEGIETREQLNLLRSMNCDMVQGWYFSKALSRENFLLYLNNN